MSVEARPLDSITPEHLFFGMPFFAFSPKLSNGNFGPFRNIGVINEAALVKEIDNTVVHSRQSGTARKIRDLIRRIDPALNLGIYDFEGENMRLALASQIATAVSGGVVSVVNDPITLTDDPEDFIALANRNLVAASIVGTSLQAAQRVDEAVGVGDGVQGGTTGDFALDFKILVIGDVTGFTVNGVDESAKLVAGTTPTANQIAIAVGTPANSGQITFGSAETPPAGAAIVATYKPSFAFALGNGVSGQYLVDFKQGLLRHLAFDGSTDPLRSFQPMEFDYDFTEVDHTLLRPFTQGTFEGRGRMRHIPDLGINWTWDIPKCAIQLTGDDLAWSQDDAALLNLAVELLDAGGTAPFGEAKIFPETP